MACCASLHAAAEAGHTDCVRRLVGAGASVERCNDDAFTPLELAIRAGEAPTCLLLLRCGARLARGGWCGRTPLAVVRDWRDGRHEVQLRRAAVLRAMDAVTVGGGRRGRRAMPAELARMVADFIHAA